MLNLNEKIRFNRNELSGAFGDIGTDIPLLIGLILVCGFNPLNVFLVFGLLQIISGLIYGIPMPLQPLKAVAAFSIAMGLGADVVGQSGLIIGIIMLVLTAAGIITRISGIVPESVIRGIQLGLGLKLILLALMVYIPSVQGAGILVAAAGTVLILIFSGRVKFPPVLLLLISGAAFGIYLYIRDGVPGGLFEANAYGNIVNEFSFINILALIVLPQLALTIGNSILATKKLAEDYFPEKKISENKISLSYSIVNMIAPLLGAVPVCHGSGGLAGHYRFGARTGGSLLIYGVFLIFLGLIFYSNINLVFVVMPIPLLGVILLFEGFAIAKMATKVEGNFNVLLALCVGFVCVMFKYGFVIGLIAGTALYMAYNILGKRKLLNVTN